MTSPAAADPVVWNYSECETRRFGLRTFRAHADTIDPPAILRRLVETHADLVILRLPSERLAEVSRLDNLGVPYVVADGLVYYTLGLATITPQPLRNTDLTITPAGSGDADVVNDLIAGIFEQYRNHYHSNPLLHQADILEGYKEWARGFVGSDRPDQACYVVRRGRHPVAMITCAFAADGVYEAVIGGVAPPEAGKGIYSDLIRHTQREGQRLGARGMRVSTQLNNYAVQKVWAREGFKLSHTIITVHLNALLERSCVPVRHEELMLKDAAVEPTSTQHVTSIVSSRVLRYADAACPGRSAAPLGLRCRVLKPLRPHRTYDLRISLPVMNEQPGFCKVVAQLTDGAGATHLLGYYDLGPSD